ncbi:helix-turn-helix domain-containing protein [Nonomuraea roseoviolacea subsp. roseoviolacea]|uniref:helix-turn-helix domain-containing protein n=1 Tax=Nonomuraea roseoviolacea TaxID=103837 RepID=UPI0031CDF739
MDTLDLLLHPVRLRIVWAMSGGVTRTTTELCERLPDVPKTTVYRHVGLLAEAGMLEIAEEQRVRGVVERHYRLRRERTVVGEDAARSMSLDDHRHGFAAAMAALMAAFNAYLDRPGADPFADLVGYRQSVLWLSRDELAEMIGELREIMAARWRNEPAPGRSPHLASAIFFPVEEPPHDDGRRPPDREEPPRDYR